MATQTNLFINNEFVPSSTGQSFSIHSPTDDSLVADKIQVASEDDVNNAVKAARAAFPAWREVTAMEKQALLLKLADLIEENTDTLAAFETNSMGAPTSTAKRVVAGGVNAVRYYAGLAGKIHGDLLPSDGTGKARMVSYEPLGVCAAIAPWNGSTISWAWKVAPAVAAGNTIVYKSSEKSPLGPLFIAGLVKQVGFPPGVINMVTGDGKVGALLASHMGVDKIAFTGSGNTGRQVQIAATKSNMKKCTLELGGKSAAVVFADANLDRAISHAAMGVLGNSGQICAAQTRILVQDTIADTFVEKLRERFVQLTESMADPHLETTGLGPLADKVQFDRVMSFLDKAKQDKLQVIVGGGRHGDTGCFVQPTLILDPDTTHTVYKDEIFGPVGVIKTFKTEEEAIAIANATEYGLSAALYTQDVGRAMRLATKFDSGALGINSPYSVHYDMPFGGWKQSGYGRELGVEGIKQYLQPKSISILLE